MGKRLITAGDVWRPMKKKPPDRKATVRIVAAVVAWEIIPVRTVRALPHLQLQVMGVRILPIFLMANVVTKVTKKYASPKHERRSYWKKRYHDHKDDIDEEYGQDKKSPRMSVKSPDKQQRSMVAPSIGNDGTNGTETIKHGLIQSESNTVVDDQERE